MTVFVAQGSSDNTYHSSRDCMYVQRAESIVEKDLDLINVHYDKCSVCEQWERNQS